MWGWYEPTKAAIQMCQCIVQAVSTDIRKGGGAKTKVCSFITHSAPVLWRHNPASVQPQEKKFMRVFKITEGASTQLGYEMHNVG